MAVEVDGRIVIAWLFKLFLLAEVLWLLAAARALLKCIEPAGVIAVLIAMMVAWRLSHATVTWALAQWLRWRDGRPLDWDNQWKALGKEIAARVVSFNWSQPFPALAMGRDPVANGSQNPKGAGDGTPILLVHGFFSSKGMWIRFRQRLVKAGMGPVYTMNLKHVFGHVKDMVPSLHDRIEAIARDTGKDKVILIAHSMGGLVSRQYLQDHGGGRVAQLITLGSPHHGTRIAKIALFTCTKDMRRRSGFLDALAEKETANPPSVPTTSIYTMNDDLVYPPETSVLPWAENISVRGVGHVSLLFDEGVLEAVRKLLRG
ncbi:MAG: alpha/beta fold hydrolase [Betaproteobacteria bacterium]|nr:alpha/beta fold hydrolase [Betaproteobacteria bacterium]